MFFRKVCLLVTIVFVLLSGTLQAENQNANQQVDSLLEQAKSWPGVIRTNIGVTRKGTKIPCLLAKDDLIVRSSKMRLLLIAGLDGSSKSVTNALAVMKWFYTSQRAVQQRKRFSMSCVVIANPDVWAANKTVKNESSRKQLAVYPPKGPAYRDPKHPEAQYLWRWIGMSAPDLVIVLMGSRKSSPWNWQIPENASPALKRIAAKFAKEFSISKPPELVGALWKYKSANMGRIPAISIDWSVADSPGIGKGLLKIIQDAQPLGHSPARKEFHRRMARTPIKIAQQLSKRYGHNLNRVAYIPALALIGRLRLGQLTNDESHRKEVVKIVEPYVSGKKATFGKRVTGSMMPGHLVFGELARTEKDPLKRKRYLTLAKRAADLGFDKQGRMKPTMPAHMEMSDSVFMGCPILTQVGKLTGEKKYFDMAVRHLRFMLKLNLRKDGLHRHSPLDETAWGRGNGFPALGLALCLSDMPKTHPGRAEILRAFQSHMRAMANHQDPTGMWHQVVDRDESYRELTVTCMTTFAMIRGIRHGWLDEKTYSPIVKRAFAALKTRISPNATLVDVCTGTGKQKSLRDYYDRAAILGYDDRGGAMALMVTTEMAIWQREQRP